MSLNTEPPPDHQRGSGSELDENPSLRSSATTHPLVAELREQIARQHQELHTLHAQLSRLEDVEILLRHHEERYRLLFETMTQGVVYQSADGSIIDANPAAQGILGLSLDQLQGRTSYDPDWRAVCADGSDLPGDQHPAMIALRSGVPVRDMVMGVDNPLRGSRTWISVTAIPLVHPGETIPYQVYTTFDDITERKQAEEARQHAATRVQILADASAAFAEAGMDEQAVLTHLAQRTADILNAACVIRLCSDNGMYLNLAVAYDKDAAIREAATAILGRAAMPIEQEYAVAQVVRSGQAMLLTALDPEVVPTQLVPEFGPAINLGQVQSMLITPLRAHSTILGNLEFIRHTPGQAGFTEEDLTLAQDLADRAGLALANARLYHEVQQAQHYAQQSKARLEALITNLPAGIGYLDRELRYQLVNPALAAINGRSVEEHIGQRVHDIIPTLASEIEKLAAQVITTGQSIENVEVQQSPGPQTDERYVWLVSYFPIPDAVGAVIGVGVVIADITAVRRAEERFVTIFEQSPIAMGITRLRDGKLTNVNTAFVELFGYEREAAIGCTTLELDLWMYPEERDLLLEQLQGNRQAAIETTARNASGEARQVSVLSEQVQFDNEPHLLVQIKDITTLKQVQQQLQELNRTLEDRVRRQTAEVEDLYDNAPSGYYALDSDGRIIRINQTLLNWLGYTREEVLGTSFSDVIVPRDRLTFAAGFGIFKTQGRVHDIDGEFLRKDGGSFPVLLNAVAVYDEHGNYLSSRATVFDNTKRKQVEDALRESEAQNRLLFEATPEAVVLFDRGGRIVRTNHAFEELVGYAAAQLHNRTLVDLNLISSTQLTQITADMQSLAQEERDIYALTLTFQRADDSSRVVEIRAFPMSIKGQVHVLAAMHDLTLEKQSEERLRLANAELSRAARSKDDFLANMSHELRTPINAILGYSESLYEGIYGVLSDRQRTAVASVESSGRHLLTLINEILDLAKVEAGRLELHIEPVLVSDICQSSLLFVREQALKKQLRLNLHMNNHEAKITVDVTRLRQMLVNLLSNAVKFTSTGGVVSLNVLIDDEAGVANFTVQDTGIGIAPEDLRRLFQPFTQLDSSLDRAQEGTGLGLALVRRLAELHGGSVTVESTVGVGSRFAIILPYNSVASPDHPLAPVGVAADSRPTLTAEQRPTRILLVDDNEANISVVQDYLQAIGFEIYVARNGYEALETASAAAPEAILMDIQMPQMDGLTAIRRLRALPDFAATPIIALTALAMPGDKERCMEAGANLFVTKPVNLQTLARTIRTLLEPRTS